MDKYRKAFFVSALAFSLPSCLSLIGALVTLSLTGLSILGSFVIAWWGMYFYLRTASKTAFWFSFALVNLYWWPLLVQSVRRSIYIIKKGDIGLVYGYGKPLTFLNHAVYESILLVPLTLTFIFGATVIRNIYKFRGQREY